MTLINPNEKLRDIRERINAWADVKDGYATRAAFVTANAATPGLGLSNGQIVWADGLAYERQTGATAIADLPGFVPAGKWHPEHFGDRSADDSRIIQLAIYAMRDAGGGTVYGRGGIYNIDGAKGYLPAYVVNHGGGIDLPNGVRYQGAGADIETWRNIANEWRMVVGIRGGNNLGITDVTIDGAWPALAPHPSDAKRGEGIIFWNGTATCRNFALQRLNIKNCAHYGIGKQNVATRGGIVSQIFLENIGGDGIDFKSFTSIMGTPTPEDDPTTVTDIFVTSFQQNPTHNDQAGVDLRGPIRASNIWVADAADLKSGHTRKTGIRINADVISNNRKGGNRLTLSGFFVGSSKANGVGAIGDNEIRGVEIASNYVTVSHGYVENCFRGYTVLNNGDTTDPRGISLIGLTAFNCNGAASGGDGFDLAAASEHVYGFGLLAENCDTGFDPRGDFHQISGTAKNCAIGLLVNSTIGHRNTYNLDFQNCGTDVSDSVGFYAVTGHRVGDKSAVIAQRQAAVDLAALADDSGWTGDDAWLGFVRMFKRDTTGANAGLFGQIGMRATGTSGANFNWVMQIRNASNVMEDRLQVLSNGGVQTPANGWMRTVSTTVAALPDAVTAGPGARHFVTDANATTFNSIVAAGGANRVPVFSDGTNWRIG